MRLKWGYIDWQWGKRSYLMGVINVTPDSFSNGGLFLKTDSALKQAEYLIEAGADILDIGGESTRPFAEPVPEEEELRRVIPVIRAIRKRWTIPISIDTYKAKVARAAIEAGADMINDVSALRFDQDMISLVKEYKIPIVIMHMKGNPKTMQLNPTYDDVLKEIKEFFKERINLLKKCGVSREKIIIDPGIGFGKRQEDNLKIIKNIKYFVDLGHPLMVGPSRKSFIGAILDKPVGERDIGTMATVAWLALKGVDLIRVHNVAWAKEILKILEAIKEA